MKIRTPVYSISIFFFLLFGLTTIGYSQTGFKLPTGKKKDKIPFELVNNLTVIPLEINGKQLSFLLDTGVNYTLLFSLYDNDSLQIKNVTPVRIRGLGDGGDIDAIKSVNNSVKVGNALDTDHKVYVIFDEKINFSPRMGIPVHGVIGYDFFKDFVVKIDYDSQLITIYDPGTYKAKRCRSCEVFDIALSENKPYVKTKVVSNEQENEAVLLIDSGASDAMWLFNESFGIVEESKNYFDDFLGLGLSGGVHGKRSKMDEVWLGKFKLEDVNVAYPDSLALRNLKKDGDRNGTLGSDILKRFTVTMDYPARKMTLRKNTFFSKPFHYNMAGIIIEHDGMVPVKDISSLSARSVRFNAPDNANTSSVTVNVNPFFTFFLAQRFVVAEVRKDSPAHLAGVAVGDEITAVNGKPFYDMRLSEINALFSSKSGKKIVLEVERNGMKVKKRFTLKEVL
ncbi:MAG: aspartyl protease family protein [Bacteroidota bacterium]